MSARDELAEVINAADDTWDKVVAPTVEWAQDMADAILAAGYSKPRTITLWGVRFVHNGAFFRLHPTKEAAQAFADEMNEAGTHVTVVTREHTPAVYGEWVTA